MQKGLQVAELLKANERDAVERLCDALPYAERSRTLGEALWWTAYCGEKPLANFKWLLDRGADPSTRDVPPSAVHIRKDNYQNTYTPLDIARLRGDTVSVERMLAAVRERGGHE